MTKTLKQHLEKLTMECSDPDFCTVYNKTKTCPTYCQTDVLHTVREWLMQKRQEISENYPAPQIEPLKSIAINNKKVRLYQIDELLEELNQS